MMHSLHQHQLAGRCHAVWLTALLALIGLANHALHADDDFPWLPIFEEHPQKAQFQEALQLGRNNNFKAAMELTEQLIADAPDDPVVREFVGHFHLTNDSLWKGVESLRKSLFMQPPGAALDRIGRRLVQLYREMGDNQQAYAIALIMSEGGTSFDGRRWAAVQSRKVAANIHRTNRLPTAALIHTLYAVPCPGPINIDGKLDDWDLSGQRTACDDVETELPVYSGNIALMYDAEHIYISIHYRDWSPMEADIDPLRQVALGWNCDSVQIRIRTNDRLSNLDCWYFKDRSESIIYRQHGIPGGQPVGRNPIKLYRSADGQFDDGFAQAFRKDDNGQGYVQELRVPMTVISDQRLAANDTFYALLQLGWGKRHRDKNLVTCTAEGRRVHPGLWQHPTSYGKIVLSPKRDLKLPPPDWRRQLAKSMAAGARFVGHAQDVRAVKFSPDGETLISAAQDGTARIWTDAPVARSGATRNTKALSIPSPSLRTANGLPPAATTTPSTSGKRTTPPPATSSRRMRKPSPISPSTGTAAFWFQADSMAPSASMT